VTIPFWKNQFQELERPQKRIAYFIIFYTCIKILKFYKKYKKVKVGTLNFFKKLKIN